VRLGLKDAFDFKNRSMYFSGFERSCPSVENLKGLYDSMPVVVEKEMFCLKLTRQTKL
jgi:hypothetical protein